MLRNLQHKTTFVRVPEQSRELIGCNKKTKVLHYSTDMFYKVNQGCPVEHPPWLRATAGSFRLLEGLGFATSVVERMVADG